MRVFNKKILFAAILCGAFTAGAASAEIITDNDNHYTVIKELNK